MEKAELINRHQPMFLSLEDAVADESIARVIDRFVDVCDLQKMKFQAVGTGTTGRPAYAAAALTRLQVYGYTNGIRSSRRLAAECERNLEVMWLTGGLKPSYKTIAEFRKNNLRPLEKLLRRFTALCMDWGLVGGTLIAVDGTKIKVSNSRKNVSTAPSLSRGFGALTSRSPGILRKQNAMTAWRVRWTVRKPRIA